MLNDAPDSAWQECLRRAKEDMGLDIYHSWLSGSRFVRLDGDAFFVEFKDEFTARFVQTHYSEKLRGMLADILECPDLVFRPVSLPRASITRRDELLLTMLRAQYTFDRFVVDDNNRVAYATATAVAKNMGSHVANPLFIYGGVGTGKTHLIQAVAHYVKEHHPELTYMYISSEEFLNRLITSFVNKNTIEEFDRLFRDVHYLLMDDVQFLAKKEALEVKLFHIFNNLYLQGRQIVFTSDRPPHEIEPLEERLVSRFQSGIVTDIKAPGTEGKVGILRQLARDYRISVEEEILYLIAETVKNNVRQLSSAMNLLYTRIEVLKVPITKELVRNILSEVLGAGSRHLNPGSISGTVAEAFSVNPALMRGKQRKRELLIPRQISMMLIRELTDTPLVEIGRFFSGRDHSTVLNSIKKIKELLEENPSLRRRVQDIRDALHR